MLQSINSGQSRKRHKATIPARPFLKLDDKALDEIRNKLIEYVKE
jgi:phage gpG-like protein